MIHTTLCYITRGSAVLLLHRVGKKKQALGDPNAGKWIGVGGKLEPGESVTDCLLREVREETGLTLTDYSYRARIEFHADSFPDEMMHLFTAQAKDAPLSPCEEGELRFVERDAFDSLPMWEGDRIFFDRIFGGDDAFFTLSLRYEGDALVHAVMNGRELTKTAEGWK